MPKGIPKNGVNKGWFKKGSFGFKGPHKKGTKEQLSLKQIQYCKKYGNQFLNKKQKVSSRKAISIGLKKYFKTHDAPFKNHKHKPETIKRIKMNRMKQKNIYKNTSIELKIQKGLKEKDIKYKTHKSILGQPDIFIEPNICIFCDGCYWHACDIHFPNSKYIFRIETDKKVNKGLKKQGYKVLRFWEHEINKNVKKCVDQIVLQI